MNRAIFLLGQCVNYASDTEAEAGRMNIAGRLRQGQALMASLEEWRGYFAIHDRRLPTLRHADVPFVPVWINPPAASKFEIRQRSYASFTVLEVPRGSKESLS